MIPRILHQTAPSKRLTPEEARMRGRLRRRLPGWEMRLWDDDDNARLFRGAYPDHADRWDRISSGVLKADIARCLFLYHFGGWYFDTDYCLLKPIPADLMSARCVLPISGHRNDLHLVCNSVLASVPRYPLWHDFVSHLLTNVELESIGEGTVEGTSGPLGLSRYLLPRLSQYSGLRLPPKTVFHPRVIWGGFHYDGDSNTCGIHWCWGSWRGKGPLRRFKNRLVRQWTSRCPLFQ
ncbi:MAG: hypothetical protein RL648_1449 [Verrucomicrobiota bacterium]|jgi:mannosyltransferase OCH1-like enzyme